MRKSTLIVAVLLVLTLLALAGCGSSSSDTQDAANAQNDIEMAVQATLTAIASESGPASETTDSDPPTASIGTPAASSASASSVTPSVVLPPQLNDFNPAPRPASSMGDPNAPVVIYEWSDYT